VFTGDRNCLKSGQDISFRDVTAQMLYEIFCVDMKTADNKRTAQDVVKLGCKSREYTCYITDSKSVADLSKKADQQHRHHVFRSFVRKSEDSIIIVNVT
jgi:hypothetical protein